MKLEIDIPDLYLKPLLAHASIGRTVDCALRVIDQIDVTVDLEKGSEVTLIEDTLKDVKPWLCFLHSAVREAVLKAELRAEQDKKYMALEKPCGEIVLTTGKPYERRNDKGI